jgi:hypothetical protein
MWADEWQREALQTIFTGAGAGSLSSLCISSSKPCQPLILTPKLWPARPGADSLAREPGACVAVVRGRPTRECGDDCLPDPGLRLSDCFGQERAVVGVG